MSSRWPTPKVAFGEELSCVGERDTSSSGGRAERIERHELAWNARTPASLGSKQMLDQARGRSRQSAAPMAEVYAPRTSEGPAG